MKNNFYSIIGKTYKIYPPYTIVGLLTAILFGCFTPITIVVNSKFIDIAIESVKNRTIMSEVIFMLAIFLFLILIKHLEWLPNYFLKEKFKLNFRRIFTNSILEKVAKLEYKELEKKETLGLIHRVKNDADNRMVTNFNYIMGLVKNFVGIIGIVAICFKVGWWVPILIMIIISIVVYLSYICGSRKFRATFDCTETDRKVDYIDMLMRRRDLAAEIKMFRTTNYLKKIYSKFFDMSTDLFHKAEIRNRPTSEVLVGLIGNVFLLAMYIIMLFPLLEKKITIGFYLAVITATLETMFFITSDMPQSLISIFDYKLYWKDVEKLIGMNEVDETTKESEKIQDFKKISFNDVYFKYPNADEYVIKGASFTFEKGKHYALIGENGAGKSTIIKLIAGLYKASKGQITIDGININDIPRDELSGMFTIAFQDYAKYYLTFKENILLGTNENELNKDKIMKIADGLKIEEFIKNSKDGYDTLLGKDFEGGCDISGGEWQRVILSRTLYSESPIRILDEPTASLDPESESQLYKLYEKLNSKDNMTIFISHRLASTQIADEILYISDGKVIERGSHSELMKLKGRYHDMFKLQKQWYVRENEIFK